MLLGSWQVNYGQILTGKRKIIRLGVLHKAADCMGVYADDYWV